ncbi:uncharacterized protein LOC131167451 [Malania oleifera]|uniref:uncharacterized protein LOC131167451 n=1 Tax=Malania oleifera TaxID=397392 RepID=UPI0025AE523B|nr:uncharacterized protein LOC131167451 [Malania oleifera]
MQYVEPCWTTAEHYATYAADFQPIMHEAYWLASSLPTIQANPAIDPGPSDPSVLTMGDHHRASRAWAEGHAEPLCCRGGTQFAERWLEADPRIVQLIRDAGFYGIYRIAHIQLDWHLFIWMPYTDEILADMPPAYADGRDLWVIPAQFMTSGVDIVGDDLHGMDGRGRGVTDWSSTHAIFVTAWEHRRDYIVRGVAEHSPMRPDDPYFTWYRSITRRFVDRTAAVYLSLADIVIEAEQISSDPAIHRLMRAALDLVHEDGRRIPERGGRHDVPARGGRPAPLRGGRHASSSRPGTPMSSPPVVQAEYLFGPSAPYAPSTAAHIAGPSSRPTDAPSDFAATPSMDPRVVMWSARIAVVA